MESKCLRLLKFLEENFHHLTYGYKWKLRKGVMTVYNNPVYSVTADFSTDRIIIKDCDGDGCSLQAPDINLSITKILKDYKDPKGETKNKFYFKRYMKLRNIILALREQWGLFHKNSHTRGDR